MQYHIELVIIKGVGFCISYNDFIKLDKSDQYEVFIDSDLNPKGKMHYKEGYIKGENEDEILISSYICHPSLANDNLSGMLY